MDETSRIKPLTRRRTLASYTPQQLFDAVLTSPVHWPGRTVRLERNSLLDYRQRSTSPHISVAELYHENSKLYPQMLPELTLVSTPVDAFRREYLRRRAVVARASGTVSVELAHPWRELLSRVAATSDVGLFYAVELRVVANGLLAVHEPISDLLQVVKQLSRHDLLALKRALRLVVHAEPNADTEPVLLILGSFARNDVLFGPRGYRRTLLEAGRLAQEVVLQSEGLGLALRPLYEFTDREVDAVVEADGVEQGTLVAFESAGTAERGQGGAPASDRHPLRV